MDPTKKRVAELASRIRAGSATAAEREEFELYSDDEPAVQALVKRTKADVALGGDWLARQEADQRLVAAEKSPLTRMERSVGVGLVVTGGIGMFVLPPLGLIALAGGALLTWSVLRVKIKTWDKDPYEDVEQ